MGWLLSLALAGSGLAQADTVVTGSLGGTSDFVFRGLSLTRGKPAAQMSVDFEFPRELYFGAFAATTDPNPGPSPNYEVDVWVGRYWSLGENFSADLRLSHYAYPDDPRRVTYDRTEITGTVGYRNALYVAAIYSPHTRAVGSSPGYHDDGAAWAFELSGRRPLNDRWAVSAGVGHYDLEQVYDDSYSYWNVTVAATIAPFEVQLAYLGVSSHADRHFADGTVGDRVAVTALWRFSSGQ
jgi:uncharacterized protein (TIGR02001 family)